MTVSFTGRKEEINDRRRRSKRRGDLSRKKYFKHEVNFIYNTFYREQVSSLYNAVQGKKIYE
ncbi:MAG: hypothetical protein KJ995_04780 [Candidatus Omnitrophica bacterium]|nr:hypothetical protein [Candidatus Omnitrophota bacterium]MBU1784849.1 hypothetical protein [Candidatus Omnitrophota bacterium]MBU1851701.1 hypothetical protein [Candidatus Omnitrophota bacterium]